MSKKSSDNDCNPRAIQRDIPAKTQKEPADKLIQMAAEQLADLLLKCWLASNSPKGTKKSQIKRSHR
jgi:hypothetical protein